MNALAIIHEALRSPARDFRLCPNVRSVQYRRARVSPMQFFEAEERGIWGIVAGEGRRPVGQLSYRA